MKTQDIIRKTAEKAAELGARKALDAVHAGPEFLTTPQAALYLGCSTQWLEIARHRGYGPIFVKNHSIVRYKKSTLDEYMAARERLNTAEEPNDA